jgi:hypothetical protein
MVFLNLSPRNCLLLANILQLSSIVVGKYIPSEQFERNIKILTACGEDGTRNGTCPSDRGTCSINPLANNIWQSTAYCVCNPGYYGNNCQDGPLCNDTSKCGSNGRCGVHQLVNGTFGEKCVCDSGFYGNNCSVNPCFNVTCENNGICSVVSIPDGTYSWFCKCPVTHFGNKCQFNTDTFGIGNRITDACQPNPCQNGGTCVRTAGGKTCTCADGFSGTNCETDVCQTNPCQNGATCVRTITGRTCTCADGFSGTNCETDVCQTNPCQNGRVCVRTAGGRTCPCAVGLFGPNCESCTTKSGYSLYGNNNYCYRHSTDNVNWNIAKQTCENEGTRLVIIETEEEWNVVRLTVGGKWVFIDFIKPN